MSYAKVLGATSRKDGYLEGNDYLVSWCVGHLVELAPPNVYDAKYVKWSIADLPILPEKWQYLVSASTKKQFGILQKLMHRPDVDSIVNSCDSGREGELIFRLVYQQAGCKKPVSRLWLSSMEENAIREGFARLKPSTEYDALYNAALCRERADWMVGINASRLFSCLYGQPLAVGRVMTPVLAMTVVREAAIVAFVPQKFYTVELELTSGCTASSRRISEKDAAENLLAECRKEMISTIQKVTRKEKSENPPLLYDLTALQRDANRLLGFTAQQTLDYAQSLYEKRLITYPRTDSRFLTEDMAASLPGLVTNTGKAFAVEEPFPIHVQQVINGSKVTDHHALLPTTRRADLSKMSAEERQLWDLVVRRMLAAFYPPCEYDATRVITQVGEHTFRTTGRVVLQNGWRDVQPLETMPRKRKGKEEAEDKALPPLQAGDTRTVTKAEVKEDMTKPPAQHTDASLLLAMENAGKELEDEALREQMKGSGIGTPATRASIIERLVQVGYVQRKGKTLLATPKGIALIGIMPAEIASPETTGRWEKALDEITTGKQDPARFMEGIRKLSAFLVRYARENQKPAHFPEDARQKKFRAQQAQRRVSQAKAVDGVVCPLCGQGKVLEARGASSAPGWRKAAISPCGRTPSPVAAARNSAPVW